MPKLENVLYALNCRAADTPSTCAECSYYVPKYSCCNLRQIMRDALDLLKEQEPITPCIRGEEGFSYNDLTRQYGCGSCGKPIDRRDEFCRHCGKRVKWDD